MIVLFTDFGTCDPYVGQVKAKIAEIAPAEVVVDLLHEVPNFNPHAGAHLLAAFAPRFQPGCVFLAVVDPGVGTPRDAVVMTSGGHWFVGPDNGLLSIVAVRNGAAKVWRIVWQPEHLSSTFHGRDLFAVIAAEIARGEFPSAKLQQADRLTVEFDANDLARIIYIDHYGNAWTGVRGIHAPRDARIGVADERIKHGDSFGFVGRGEVFWFVNSVGLVELAVNRGHAAEKLRLKIGDPVQLARLN